MIVAATPRGLAGLWFEGQRHLPATQAGRQAPDHPVLVLAKRRSWPTTFAGRRTTFDLPLDLQGGTPFQQSVWQALAGHTPCGAPSATAT
jgi:methylated-DNA-[protein]-cysteine S-methyltransferase